MQAASNGWPAVFQSPGRVDAVHPLGDDADALRWAELTQDE
jgi:hypothetical protein